MHDMSVWSPDGHPTNVTTLETTIDHYETPTNILYIGGLEEKKTGSPAVA